MKRQVGYNNLRAWSFFGSPGNYPFSMTTNIFGNYNTIGLLGKKVVQSKAFNLNFCRSIIRCKDANYYDKVFHPKIKPLSDCAIVS